MKMKYIEYRVYFGSRLYDSYSKLETAKYVANKYQSRGTTTSIRKATVIEEELED